jgi:hypothetical protein
VSVASPDETTIVARPERPTPNAPAGTETTLVTKPEPKASDTFCPNCGTKAGPGLLFCTDCGANLATGVPFAASQRAPQAQAEVSKTPIYFGVGAVVVALIIAFIVLYGG